MSTHRDDLVNPTGRLPELRLPALSGGAAYALRLGRSAPVLVLVHAAGCEACERFVAELDALAPELQEWDARVLVVGPDAPGEAGPPHDSRFPRLSDPEARLASALSVRAPAVVIADQWGQVHERNPAGDDHRFPAPAELVDWLRFLAVRCPECEGEAL
jgi:peroxiredoxin